MSKLKEKIEHYNRKIEESLQLLKTSNKTWPSYAWAIDDIYDELKKIDSMYCVCQELAFYNLTNTKEAGYEELYHRYLEYWKKNIVEKNVEISDSDYSWQTIAFF